LLDELLRAPGPSGAEDAVSKIVRREAAALSASVEGDALGSTVARIAGTEGGRLLALFAHVDEIGMVVRSADPGGLVHVNRLGSWRAAHAVLQRVEILTARGVLPGVVTRAGDGEVNWRDLRIDIGAGDRAEALSLVAPGDPVVVAAAPVELYGNRIASSSLDDRAGVYSALEALRGLAAKPPAWDVAFVATTQEEGSAHGATAVAGVLRPDVSLVLDTTYAGDAPGVPAWGDVSLGGGPVVFRGPPTHPAVAGGLMEAAKAAGVSPAVEVGPQTDSDADSVAAAGGGLAVGLLSIPLRNMHTAVEVVDLADVDAAVRVVEAYARSLDPGLELAR
jgi:putative aminopeptidase FrvX